ncbi:MAG: SpoIID/LytB domain-containing protein [Candidatus Avigastranaerophilus sp.]
MYNFKKLIIIFILILLITFQTAEASDNHIPVRVGISNTNFNTYLFDSIEFNDINTLNIMDAATGYQVCPPQNGKILKVTSYNNLFRIYIDDVLVARNLTGPILITPRDSGLISIKDLKRKGKQALYRGAIELTESKKGINTFAIVNVLSLKNYLRGVVPNEMPVRFGLEALKAQTVAARNYAVTPRVKAYEEFDVCDSVACQVYFGANTEEELSDKAIEETNGIIALDKEDKPILALYSSTAGGYTESYENAFSDPKTKNFPSEAVHYLTAVPDREEFGILDSDDAAENFYMTMPDSFDDLSPYYRWSKDWTESELEKVLSKTLVAQSKTGFVSPELKNEKDFGHLENINVLKRGNSGKVIELEIITNLQKFIVQKELVIRRCFQKNGISLPSANFVITYIQAASPVYKFAGGGFGHGVGLSQWGAGKMASLGFTFDQILQHYYRGIKLATIPVNVIANNKTVERVFYCNKHAKVFILNPQNINEMTITVNNKEINVKLKDEMTIADISKYINNGINKISYTVNDDSDYNKSLKVYVEIKEAVDG